MKQSVYAVRCVEIQRVERVNGQWVGEARIAHLNPLGYLAFKGVPVVITPRVHKYMMEMQGVSRLWLAKMDKQKRIHFVTRDVASLGLPKSANGQAEAIQYYTDLLKQEIHARRLEAIHAAMELSVGSFVQPRLFAQEEVSA